MLRWLWVAAVVAVLDQITKQVASATLEMYQSVAVLPFFNLTLMHNTGAAFSFLSQQGGWQRWFFALVAVVVTGVLTVWLRRLTPGQKWLAFGLVLIIGGALGNLWDRLAYGYVVDFIDVYYNGWHWPAFNIADAAITVGAAILIIDSFRSERAGEPAQKKGE